MEMKWDEKNRELRFSVFQKPNQALKYAGRTSTRRPTTFKSIASGLYPDHTEALFIADLVPPTDFPTFQEVWQDNEKQKNEPTKSKRSKRDQLLVSVAYWRFLNIRDNFSGDLSMKSNCNIISCDFVLRLCNCSRATK
eukprot:15222404-Ditylum_brightwellii.AAC.1